MKKLSIYLTAFLFMAGIFTACDDDDDDQNLNPPEFQGADLSDDNSVLTVSFSKGVYQSDDGTGALTADAFDVSIEGGSATLDSFTVEHTAGEAAADILINYNNVATGEEVISVAPMSIYDEDGAAMDAGANATAQMNNLGIAGNWYSSGDNVAPLLATYFNVDSIYAEFYVDQTYVVESYDQDGVMTEYLGTYVQEESDVEGIWTITLNQSNPSSLTSEGIFGLFPGEAGYDMKYEVVQTEPDLGNSPPTPENGFGSSNNGELGETNIQKFIKYEE